MTVPGPNVLHPVIAMIGVTWIIRLMFPNNYDLTVFTFLHNKQKPKSFPEDI